MTSCHERIRRDPFLTSRHGRAIVAAELRRNRLCSKWFGEKPQTGAGAPRVQRAESRGSPGVRRLVAAAVLSLLAAAAARAAPNTARPLLVTVDDLPMGAGDKHRDPADRDRITRGLLAALAKHRIQAVGLRPRGDGKWEIQRDASM